MNTPAVFRCAAVGVLCLWLLPAGTSLAAQSDGTPPDGGGAPPGAAAGENAADEAALAAVATMDRAVSNHDAATVKPLFTTLDQNWSALTPKTVKRVTKSIGGMFAKLKPRDAQDIDTLGEQARNGPTGDDGSGNTVTDDPRQDVMDCYHAAIGLLYDKPDGPAVLLPVLKLPHVKIWPEVQVLVIEGLGHRGEAALEKEFEPYLKHELSRVASAAAEALGRLRDQPVDVRRRAVSAIVDAFSAAQKASDKEAGKLGEDDEHPARRYLASITVSYRDALTSLTRQSFDQPPEWREWFDAHGKETTW